MSNTSQAVYDQALRWLAQRSYGERELARRLEQTGADPETIEWVLDRCLTLGYLDDRAFAASRTRLRLNRGYGQARVRAELLHLGIDPEVIAEIIQESEEEHDPLLLAQRELVKRFGHPNEKMDFRERRRRYDFLARRGFAADVIEAALSE